MARVKYTDSDIALMARIMRAEAEGEGRLGMLLVDNVIVNRLKANCLDFEGLRSIPHVIFQVQGGNYSFEAVQKQPFAGQYKQNCYYEPKANTCEGAYRW